MCEHTCTDCHETFDCLQANKPCPITKGWWRCLCMPCERKTQVRWLKWLETKPEGRLYDPPVIRKGVFDL